VRTWIGTWIAISVLLALLVAAIYVAYVGWNLTDVAMPLTGYVAMGLGILFSLVLGVGLMGLMFYSSRHGYDEPPSKPPKGFKWE
jgi:hypothetical protein